MNIVNVSVFSGHRNEISTNMSINIEGRYIKQLSPTKANSVNPPGFVIDGTDLTAIPGLVNLHVHLCLDGSPDPLETLLSETDSMTFLRMALNAKKTVEGGITTIRDMGTRGGLIFELREAIEEELIPGPRIVASGNAITRTGGHCSWIGCEADGQIGVMNAVRKQLKLGADCTKIIATGGTMTPGTSPYLPSYSFRELQAAVEESRRGNVQIAAHAHGWEGIELAAKAGVDTIEHGTLMSEDIIKMLVDKGIVWVPTLSPHHRFTETRITNRSSFSCEDESPIRSAREKEERGRGKGFSEEALATFAKFHMTDNLKIGLGNDAGVPFVPHGNLALEMQMFKDFGFSNYEVLKKATFGNAQILRLDDRIGSLQEGKLADIVLIKGNPLKHLAALSEVKYVVKNGAMIYQYDT